MSEDAFKGVVILPVREIGEVIFADAFRQSFAVGRVQARQFIKCRVMRHDETFLNYLETKT